MVVIEAVLGEMGQRWKGRYAAEQKERGRRGGTGSIDLTFDYVSALAIQSDIPYSGPLLGVVHIHILYASQVDR